MNNTSHFTKEEHKRRVKEFEQILDRITREKGMTEFEYFDKCDVDPLYMESFLKGDNPNFPSPISLKRIADNSNGLVSYTELLQLSGHNKIIYDKEVTQEIKRGEIYICNLGEGVGSEIYGIRPCLVISNNIGNRVSPMILVAPITSQIKKVNQSTHVLLDERYGLEKPSIVQLEQLKSIDKSRLQKFVGKVYGKEKFDEINRAYSCAGGIYSTDTNNEKYELINNIDKLEEDNEEVTMFKKLYNNLFGSKSESIETLFNK